LANFGLIFLRKTLAHPPSIGRSCSGVFVVISRHFFAPNFKFPCARQNQPKPTNAKKCRRQCQWMPDNPEIFRFFPSGTQRISGRLDQA